MRPRRLQGPTTTEPPRARSRLRGSRGAGSGLPGTLVADALQIGVRAENDWGRQAKAALLGSDRNPAGGRVVTYNKWPLYTYVADTAPGQAKGQALNLNGGLWYVLSPSGKVIRTK